MLTRSSSIRPALVCLLVWCLGILSASAQPPDLDRAVDWLIAQQDADGAWRSETYGSFRDGPSLTPFIAETLARHPKADAAVRKAKTYLLSLEDDALERVPLPVYTAASALKLTGDKRFEEMLRSRHFNQANGFAPEAKEFGAWGYTSRPLGGRDPVPFARKHDTNLSATLTGLQALQHDPTVRAGAIAFAMRCQNQETGGFFFSPTDLTRNKAGDGRAYGSATADGLRLYLAAGLGKSDLRVLAARDWLLQNFTAERHPGDFTEDREALRGSYFFYYAASVSEAFTVLEEDGDAVDIEWRSDLSKELGTRQHANGSWSNTFTDAKEDDPLIATSLALRCLQRTSQETGGRP